MKPMIALGLLLILSSVFAVGQDSGLDVERLVGLIESGQGDQIKADLPSLLSKYPNNPGVLYVQGLLSDDGAEAVRIYQSIVDNFPRSEWADDALYKVYQFYYSLGLYRTAELKMDQLKRDYPSSKYLGILAGGKTENLPEERDTTHAETPSALQTDSTDVRATASREQTPGQEQFVLQVGAYTAQVNAERQKRFFEDLGYPVEVISKVRDSRSLYLVLVGSFKTYDEAKAKGIEIRQKHNINSFVITR